MGDIIMKWIAIGFVGFLIFIWLFILSLLKGINQHKTEEERERDDQEQIEYLAKWSKEHEKKNNS